MAIAIGNNQFTQVGQIKIGNSNVQRVYRGNDLIFPLSGFNGRVWAIKVQPDGKILVGGEFTTYNELSYNRIIRFNNDGSIDNTFNIGTGFNATVYAIEIENGVDGVKILVGGDFTGYNNTLVPVNRIARLFLNGTVDSSLQTLSGFNDSVRTIKFRETKPTSSSGILVGGAFTSYRGVTANRIILLNVFGGIDSRFVAPLAGQDGDRVGFRQNEVLSIEIDSLNRIVVGGSFFEILNFIGFTTVNHIYRFNEDTSRDSSFDTGSGSDKAFNGTVFDLKIGENNSIYCVGFFISYNGTPIGNHIAKLNANGSRDTSFNTGTGLDQIGRQVVIQSDGKIVAGGLFSSYNGIVARQLVRLNTNGTVDTTFSSGLGISNDPNNTEFRSLALNGNNILFGGLFNSYNGEIVPKNYIQLLPNGTKV
jgi:uncharacterized delta-60 repeat protein